MELAVTMAETRFRAGAAIRPPARNEAVGTKLHDRGTGKLARNDAALKTFPVATFVRFLGLAEEIRDSCLPLRDLARENGLAWIVCLPFSPHSLFSAQDAIRIVLWQREGCLQ
jgi:hypothetical protein